MDNILIIHIGAPKCASSSIQESLKKLSKINKKVYFHLLKCGAKDNDYPFKPDKFSIPQDDKDSIGKVIKNLILSKKKINIISHESLFDSHSDKVTHILEEIGNKQYFKKIYIVGFVRKISSFIDSSFEQWHFRDKNFLLKQKSYLSKIGIDSNLLLPKERNLVSFLFKNKNYIGWNASLKKVDSWKRIADNYSLDLSFGFDHIPVNNYEFDLLKRFLDLCKISFFFSDKELAAARVKVNKRYSFILTNAISMQIIDNPYLAKLMPKPHELNYFLEVISSNISKNEDVLIDFEEYCPYSNYLLENLQSVIDQKLYFRNSEFAETFDFPKEVFLPKLDKFKNWEEKKFQNYILNLVNEICQMRNVSDFTQLKEGCFEIFSIYMKKTLQEFYGL